MFSIGYVLAISLLFQAISFLHNIIPLMPSASVLYTLFDADEQLEISMHFDGSVYISWWYAVDYEDCSIAGQGAFGASEGNYLCLSESYHYCPFDRLSLLLQARIQLVSGRPVPFVGLRRKTVRYLTLRELFNRRPCKTSLFDWDFETPGPIVTFWY